MADRHEGKYAMKKESIFTSFLSFAKDYLTSGCRWGGKGHSVFQEIRPGACFKTGDFVKETLGGGLP